MRIIKIALVLFIAVQLHMAGQENNSNPAFVSDSLDAYIVKSMQDWQIPGLAIGIVKDGKIVKAKGYGTLGLTENETVNENTLFMIGSNTKAFTATALALLAEEKICSLNDKVVRWLPEFKMRDPWITKELSLTDLLCHRIGMESYQGDFIYWNSNLKTKQVMEKFGKLQPAFSFRSRYGYTNAAFAIAGECIEKISGKSWSDYLKMHFFDPLQMSRTQSLSVDFAAQQNVCIAHTMRNDTLIEIPIENIDNLKAAGSIGSSALDMCHWLLCELDSGRYLNRQIIPFSVIQITRSPQTIVGISNRPFNSSHFALYGLGWRLMDYDGKEIIFHAGAVDGFHSSVSLLPELGLGIVILTNTDSNDFYEALKWDIIDSYLNLPARNYSQLYLSQSELARSREESVIKSWRDSAAMKPVAAHKLTSYTGKYSNEVYGKINITESDRKLIIHFEHHPDLTGILECLGGNRFLCSYSNPEFGVKALNFTVEKKKPVELILRVSSDIDDSPYIFKKK